MLYEFIIGFQISLILKFYYHSNNWTNLVIIIHYKIQSILPASTLFLIIKFKLKIGGTIQAIWFSGGDIQNKNIRIINLIMKTENLRY